MRKRQLGRSLRVGFTSSLVAALLLTAIGLRPDAASAAEFTFRLTRDPGDAGSWYKSQGESGTFQMQYEEFSVLTLELPTTDDNLHTLQSGTASITDFFLPPDIIEPGVIGMVFRFGNVPSILVGSVNVLGNHAKITFPGVNIPFERGTNLQNPSPGTLSLNLTTEGTTIPGGRCGRPPGGQFIPGVRLNLINGSLGLVASMCPYSTNAAVHEDAFVLALRGAVVPEPATSLLLGVGMLVVLALARRKSAT